MSSLTAMGGGRGRLVLDYFALQRNYSTVGNDPVFLLPFSSSLLFKEGSYSFSLILILSLLLSYNISLLERQLLLISLSQFYSLSLLQGEARQGWGN